MMRFVPLACLLVFVGIGVGWRAYHHWNRFGATGIALFRSGRAAQHMRDALLVLLLIIVGSEAVAAAFVPALLRRLRYVPGLDSSWAAGSGAALVIAATALMAASQLHLGASWRIGIEEDARPGLVTRGFYRFCRNPIFVFMLAGIAGFVLLIPTWMSLAMWVATYVGIRAQVVQEESYLLRTYGEEYRAYANRVGRFMPGVGRLS